LKDIVDEIKELEGKENLFAEFPIGATMQDGGKRKEANARQTSHQILILNSK